MEPRKTITIDERDEFQQSQHIDNGGKLAEERLESLLSENAEFERQRSVYSSEQEKLEVELMEHPLPPEKAFSYFGLLLGTFPPAAFFSRLLFNSGGNIGSGEAWIIGLMLLVIVAASAAGYFSGKLVGKAVFSLEKYPWWAMLFVLPFLGLLWGLVAGAAGGVILFVFGAIIGAIIGGAVGSVALPVFAVLHRLLKSGDMIDRKDFLPVAIGITAAICAFILGVPA